ncbi:MAG: SCO1664 family protein [Dehalococcoidia bacterium]
MTAEASVGFEEAETLLREGEFQDSRPLWYSSNYVFLAQLCAGEQTLTAVYKPRRGENPLWDFPDGTLFQREVAAYRLSRILEWPVVPPTVVRVEGPQGVGSLQLYIRHDPKSHFFEQREAPELVPQLKRMAVFDYLANNADRKGGHCLLDEEGHIWGIDHGLCFHDVYKMRTVIWDWAEERIPKAMLEDVAGLHDRLRAADDAVLPLAELLAPAEVSALIQRAAKLLATRTFPAPGPHRSYPWPLV